MSELLLYTLSPSAKYHPPTNIAADSSNRQLDVRVSLATGTLQGISVIICVLAILLSHLYSVSLIFTTWFFFCLLSSNIIFLHLIICFGIHLIWLQGFNSRSSRKKLLAWGSKCRINNMLFIIPIRSSYFQKEAKQFVEFVDLFHRNWLPASVIQNFQNSVLVE